MPQLVQPKQEEAKPDEDDGEEGGVEGGVAGGVKGGTVGGVVGGTGTPPPVKAKNVPAHVFDSEKLSGEMPHLPDIVKIQRKGTGEAVVLVEGVRRPGWPREPDQHHAGHPRRRQRHHGDAAHLEVQAAAGSDLLALPHRLHNQLAEPLAASGGLVAALLEIQPVFLRCSLLGRHSRVGLDALATARN